VILLSQIPKYQDYWYVPLCSAPPFTFLIFVFYFIYLFVIILLLNWRYFVALTKVLTIYCSWIHPLRHSPLSLLPAFYTWNSFNRSHFSIYIST
jgi:hypothetical protein